MGLVTPGYEMKFSVLGSGSKGNSVYIESGRTALLIDAGFSGKETKRRLNIIGRTAESIKAVCITHEHNDHIKGVGVLSRQCSIPAYANTGTFNAADSRIGKLFGWMEFETGDTFVVDDLIIRSFRVSHDTADPVGFVVSDGKRSLGYCTDTGKVSHLMARRLKGCHALILEFNHNLEMLKNGPYPLPLQQRVRSSLGHLSNDAAAGFLNDLQSEDLQQVVLAHLSEVNNTPDLAFKALNDAVKDRSGRSFTVALQHDPLQLMDV